MKWEEARAEMRAVLRAIDSTDSKKRKRDLRRHYRRLEKQYREARRHYKEAKKGREEE